MVFTPIKFVNKVAKAGHIVQINVRCFTLLNKVFCLAEYAVMICNIMCIYLSTFSKNCNP